MAIAGKVAITPKGEWNAQTAYTKLDLVFYDNASYVAIQPSTGVEPTNESYWMLMVQSAGGADLEAIIDGTQQVGNAKKLDGHGAEYFFPKSGGAINGNLTVNTTEDTYRTINLKNATRALEFALYSGGAFRLYDGTNNKAIITSTADGTTTFNGTASGNLPLDGGTIKSTSNVPVVFNTTNSNPNVLRFQRNGANLGHIGFVGVDEPTFINGAGDKVKYLLHTGNKPTGTYTGNGDATQRTINTGGVGNWIAITNNSNASEVFISVNGGFGKKHDGTNASTVGLVNSCGFSNGNLQFWTDDYSINASGVTYTYQVL